MMLSRTARLINPMMNRNDPEMVGPIRPVALCSVEPSLETSPLRPRTPIANSAASAKTIVEWPSEKKNPTLERPLTVGHQLARGVVDRADVIGVERVAQTERVGGDPDADPEHAAARAEVEVAAGRRRPTTTQSPRRAARGSRTPTPPPGATPRASTRRRCGAIARFQTSGHRQSSSARLLESVGPGLTPGHP